jgi:hypothetical protein
MAVESDGLIELELASETFTPISLSIAMGIKGLTCCTSLIMRGKNSAI